MWMNQPAQSRSSLIVLEAATVSLTVISMYFLSREPRQMDRDRNGMTFENFYGANILIWND